MQATSTRISSCSWQDTSIVHNHIITLSLCLLSAMTLQKKSIFKPNYCFVLYHVSGAYICNGREKRVLSIWLSSDKVSYLGGASSL